MTSYLIKILVDTPTPSTDGQLTYLRRFDAEDIGNAIRIIDAALSAKPRKKRSDAGKNKEVE